MTSRVEHYSLVIEALRELKIGYLIFDPVTKLRVGTNSDIDILISEEVDKNRFLSIITNHGYELVNYVCNDNLLQFYFIEKCDYSILHVDLFTSLQIRGLEIWSYYELSRNPIINQYGWEHINDKFFYSYELLKSIVTVGGNSKKYAKVIKMNYHNEIAPIIQTAFGSLFAARIAKYIANDSKKKLLSNFLIAGIKKKPYNIFFYLRHLIRIAHRYNNQPGVYVVAETVIRLDDLAPYFTEIYKVETPRNGIHKLKISLKAFLCLGRIGLVISNERNNIFLKPILLSKSTITASEILDAMCSQNMRK